MFSYDLICLPTTHLKNNILKLGEDYLIRIG